MASDDLEPCHTAEDYRLEALLAAVEILRNHGYRPDPEKWPTLGDQANISQRFADLIDQLEGRYDRLKAKMEARRDG